MLANISETKVETKKGTYDYEYTLQDDGYVLVSFSYSNTSTSMSVSFLVNDVSVKGYGLNPDNRGISDCLYAQKKGSTIKIRAIMPSDVAVNNILSYSIVVYAIQ